MAAGIAWKSAIESRDFSRRLGCLLENEIADTIVQRP